MAQKRTIEYLHSKEYGHRKFAQICDLFIKDGYEVTNINEYYEKFSFELNGVKFEFQKNWKKASAKDIETYYINVLNFEKMFKK